MAAIREYMLSRPPWSEWRTLIEIEADLGFPQASISAQLRHLRKERFGSYCMEKRRRGAHRGTWEYRVLPPPPPGQVEMFQEAVSLEP